MTTSHRKWLSIILRKNNRPLLILIAAPVLPQKAPNTSGGEIIPVGVACEFKGPRQPQRYSIKLSFANSMTSPARPLSSALAE